MTCLSLSFLNPSESLGKVEKLSSMTFGNSKTSVLKVQKQTTIVVDVSDGVNCSDRVCKTQNGVIEGRWDPKAITKQ